MFDHYGMSGKCQRCRRTFAKTIDTYKGTYRGNVIESKTSWSIFTALVFDDTCPICGGKILGEALGEKIPREFQLNIPKLLVAIIISAIIWGIIGIIVLFHEIRPDEYLVLMAWMVAGLLVTISTALFAHKRKDINEMVFDIRYFRRDINNILPLSKGKRLSALFHMGTSLALGILNAVLVIPFLSQEFSKTLPGWVLCGVIVALLSGSISFLIFHFLLQIYKPRIRQVKLQPNSVTEISKIWQSTCPDKYKTWTWHLLEFNRLEKRKLFVFLESRHERGYFLESIFAQIVIDQNKATLIDWNINEKGIATNKCWDLLTDATRLEVHRNFT